MKKRENVNETTTEHLEDAARRVADAGRDTASRATEYLRGGLDRAGDYAQDWSGKASDQIAALTGRPPEAWTRELRSFVEQHPMRSLLITVGIGYALGKLVRHG
jgi:ElaB/YqjD/DUF883 family membrane-anchored ribosome-binding protein